jgi:hypothetical protein
MLLVIAIRLVTTSLWPIEIFSNSLIHNDRMATDLNLHRKTSPISQDTLEGKAREAEVHNRVRTWLLCFCLDRSLSSQMGKPSSIKEDDIIRNALSWSQQPLAIPADRSLACYVVSSFLFKLSSSLRLKPANSGIPKDAIPQLGIFVFFNRFFVWFAYQH